MADDQGGNEGNASASTGLTTAGDMGTHLPPPEGEQDGVDLGENRDPKKDGGFGGMGSGTPSGGGKTDR